MDAIITAGGIPLPGEPLFEYTQGKPKALVEVAGKPMIQWVLDAISRATRIEHIVVIGLPELGGVTCTKPTAFIANQKDMIANIKAGIKAIQKLNPNAEYTLISASDVPAITPQMVDWMVEKVENSDSDIIYNVISKNVMESRYPNSKRTYTHVKDMDLCGGDLNAVRIAATNQLSTIVEKLVASRKNPVKQASMLGFDVLFGLLSRTATIDEMAKKISKKLGIKGKALVCPYAELGMDVDKPHQLEIMRADLTPGRVSR